MTYSLPQECLVGMKDIKLKPTNPLTTIPISASPVGWFLHWRTIASLIPWFPQNTTNLPQNLGLAAEGLEREGTHMPGIPGLQKAVGNKLHPHLWPWAGPPRQWACTKTKMGLTVHWVPFSPKYFLWLLFRQLCAQTSQDLLCRKKLSQSLAGGWPKWLKKMWVPHLWKFCIPSYMCAHSPQDHITIKLSTRKSLSQSLLSWEGCRRTEEAEKFIVACPTGFPPLKSYRFCRQHDIIQRALLT